MEVDMYVQWGCAPVKDSYWDTAYLKAIEHWNKAMDDYLKTRDKKSKRKDKKWWKKMS